MVNGIRMQKATKNHCIKDQMVFSSTIIMAKFKTNYSGASSLPIGSPGETVMNSAIKKNKTSTMKICTWNVRSMAQAGKINNAIQEMNRLNADVMGISEMRWPGSGHCEINDHTVYYSGNTNNKHIHGVGIIISKKIQQTITNFTPISERMLLIQLNSPPLKINIIQIYAPTCDKPDDVVEELYSTLSDTLKQLNKHEVTIIMGDLNAKIGKGKDGEYIGEYGLGTRNERGDRLKRFIEEEEYIILNTFFKLPPRRLYTWTSAQDQPNNVIRNQIDYILINKRFRNSCLSVKTYPSAEISSDHNALIGKFKLKLKKVARKTNTKKWNMRKLKEPDVKETVTSLLNQRCNNIEMSNNTETTIEKLSKTLNEIGDEHLTDERIKKKSWMTDEILKLMEERRRAKNDASKYKETQRKIRQQIRTAKENWTKTQCEEIETLERKHDLFNMHKKIRETAGTYKTNTTGRLHNTDDKIIINKAERMDIWKNYITELFEDNRTELPPEPNNPVSIPITENEVTKAITQLKDGKSPGPDNTYSELLKLFDVEGVKRITKIFNNVYSTGKIPKQWLKSTFILLPKKPSAKYCCDYRTISLMSHLLKLFLKIIHQRIVKICEENISRTQFGFRNAVGTREALFSVQVLVQRCRDFDCDVHTCFIDYQKAFDNVQHDKLMEILKNIGLEDNDRRIIGNLYWNQTASLRIQGETTEDIKIKKGVRQGCVLSSILFNIYSEQIFQEALEDIDAGIKINGENINNIRYADDTAVFADSLENLQELMTRITETSQRYGLPLNIKKTKYMIISKNTNHPGQLTVNGKVIEKVKTHTYLGATINSDWEHSLEIKCRIEKSRTAFIKMSKLFRTHDLSLSTKIRLLKCYVFPVLLYGVESWTLTEASCKKLEAFEMWLYRRILKIPWTEHVTNKDVLERIGKEKELLLTIKSRKLEYLGHIMRNDQRYGLLQLILQGRVKGKRGPGRRRISWLKNLRTWFNTTTIGLFRAATNKVKIAMMIANIRNG